MKKQWVDTYILEDYISKCKVILIWATKHISFNTNIIESILEYTIKNDFISVKQRAVIDKIITSWRVPYDGTCENCGDSGIAYLSDDVYGECVHCNVYHLYKNPPKGYIDE